jgi:mono/diheme cytochrome c family protein
VALILSACASGIAGARQGTGAPAEKSVWDGVFTNEQADRGRSAYVEWCASCHGAALEGGEYRALTGDRFWTSWQSATVDRLLGQISANMPHSEDGSLKGTLGAGTYADIVAHILRSNGFPAGARELTAGSAAGVAIVRKDGSTELPAGSFVQVVGCLARGDKPGQWTLQRASAPARVLAGDSSNADTPLGDRQFALLFVLTPLEKFVGHRMSVQGSLVGPGGTEGVNVTTVRSVSESCL